MRQVLFCTCSDLHYVVSRLVQNALCTSNCFKTETVVSHVQSAKINDNRPCFISGGTNFGFMNGAKWGNYKDTSVYQPITTSYGM